jgi:hypothetical protein
VLQNLNAYPWMWTVERLNPPDQDYVSLRYFTYYLRANGRYLPWNIRVTADVDPDAPRVTTMMHWMVHQVAVSPVPQPLPVTGAWLRHPFSFLALRWIATILDRLALLGTPIRDALVLIFAFPKV